MSLQTIAAGAYSGTEQRSSERLKPHGTWIHEHTFESSENGALMEEPLIVPVTLIRHYVRKLNVEYLRDLIYLIRTPTS